MKPFPSIVVSILLGLSTLTAVRAEVGDPTIQTDHPFYPGEGAFQTAADVVAFATRGASGEQERAIQLYNWLLNHQWHLASPQEPNGTDVLPDTAEMDRYELMVTDAARGRFSYGYGLCGTVHAWNEPYWKALGFNARRRAFPGHTNSEVEYGGSWHAFDTDMAGLIFRPDGTVAGYEDVIQDPKLILRSKPPIPCYPFDWPNDHRTMAQGWRQVAAGGNWYKMYHSGYEAHPGIVHLRAGERFTRYYDRDVFGGPSRRRFWHHQPGGPLSNWSFVNQGVPFHEEAKSNARGEVSYCNGEFVYEPDLRADRFREGVRSASANVAARSSNPFLYTRDGEPATCTFEHFSPYVICGDPVEDANPMTAPATGGLVVAGQSIGPVRGEVSVDGGQSWQLIGEANGTFEWDVTDLVKGRYGWLVRFTWRDANGLEKLRFTTVTQVCQTIYPRLQPNGSHVRYRSRSRGVVPLLPNFGLAEESLEDVEVRELRSENIEYTPRSAQNRMVYRTKNNRPGQMVFRITAPQPLTEITAAFRFSVSVPPPPNCEFRADASFDEGESWQPFAEARIPTDNEYSSGWLAGRCEAPIGSRIAWIRVHVYAGGRPTGLLDAQAYGIYRTGGPDPLMLTYSWREGDRERSHRESIPAGAAEHSFVVPTGSEIRDDSIRLEVGASAGE